jgi:hypothetical protein
MPLARTALILSAALGFVALTGCYDFAGDRERVGFSTDATVDGHEAWTPETPLAVGTILHLEATEILGTEEAPIGPARFEGSRHLEITPDDDGVTLRSEMRRAWVQVDVDGVRDDFRLRWSPAARGRLIDPIDRLLAEADPTIVPVVDGLTLLEGGALPLGYVLEDRAGTPLGYVAGQLALTTDAEGIASVTVGPDGRSLVVAGIATGGTAIEVAWPGAEPLQVPVDVVSAGQIDDLLVERLEVDGKCVLHAMLFSDGAVVAGATGFDWSHEDTDDAFANCPDGPAEVHWNRWTAAL